MIYIDQRFLVAINKLLAEHLTTLSFETADNAIRLYPFNRQLWCDWGHCPVKVLFPIFLKVQIQVMLKYSNVVFHFFIIPSTLFHWQQNGPRAWCQHHHASQMVVFLRLRHLWSSWPKFPPEFFYCLCGHLQIEIKLEVVDSGAGASYLDSSLSIHGNVKLTWLWTVTLVFQQHPMFWCFLGFSWTTTIYPISSQLNVTIFFPDIGKVATPYNNLYFHTNVWNNDLGICNCLDMLSVDIPELC